MNLLQKLSIGVVASVLTTALFGMVVLAGLMKVIGSPDTVKGVLRESGIYDTAVKGLLENQNPSKDSVSKADALDFNQPEVIAAAEKAFSPQFLRQSTEQFIDGLHPWLEGEVDKPDFSISFASAKDNFIDNLIASARTRINGLPVCKAGNAPSDFDPFSATCKPAGLNVDSELQKLRRELDSEDMLLAEERITADTFKADEGSQSAFTTDLQDLPEGYQRLKSMPVIFALTAAVAAVALILLSPDKRRGVRRVAVILITIGGLLVVGAVVVNFLIDRVGEIVLQDGEISNTLKDSAIRFVDKLGDAIRGTYLSYAVAFIVLGIGMLTALHFTGTRGDDETAADSAGKDTAAPAKA